MVTSIGGLLLVGLELGFSLRRNPDMKDWATVGDGTKLELIREDEYERQFFLIEASSPAALDIERIPRLMEVWGIYGCLVAWDADTGPSTDTVHLATWLVKSDCRFATVVGKEAERVTSWIDSCVKVQYGENVLDARGRPPVITWFLDPSKSDTTSRGKPDLESLTRIFLIGDLLFNPFHDALKRFVCISIGNSEWAALMRRGLGDPRGLRDEYGR